MGQTLTALQDAGRVETYCAGWRPSGKIHSKAIRAMQKPGYDLSTHHFKLLKEVEGTASYDAVAIMGSRDVGA